MRLKQPDTLARNAPKLALLQAEVFSLLRGRLETILAACGFYKPVITVGSELITVGPLNTLARPETAYKYTIEISNEISGPLRPAPAENWRHGLQVPVPDPYRTPVSHDVRMQLYQDAKTHLPELLQAWEVFEKAFLKYASKAGIAKNVFPHCFRATGLTHMLRNGAHVRHLMGIAGHASMEALNSYLAVEITDLKETHAKTHPRELETGM